MEIKKFNDIFSDLALREVLRGPEAQEISKKTIISNLMLAKDRDKLIPPFMDAVQKSAEGTAQKILKKFHKTVSAYTGPDTETLKKLVESCKAESMPKKKKEKTKLVKVQNAWAAASSEAIQFDKFPEEACTLSDLRKRAEKLRANNFEKATQLINEIKKRTNNDPAIQNLTNNDAEKWCDIASQSHPPFDYNRTGREIEGLFVNASDVTTKRQNFILAGCPRDLTNTRDYFEAAQAHKVKVFVSLLPFNEAKDRINNYWKNEVVSKITLREGSQIVHLQSTVLDQNETNPTLRLVETTLELAKRKVTHLHLEGWEDRNPIPDERLMYRMLDRIYEMSLDPKVPISINCKAGVGRTGTTAVSLFLRREVDAQLAKGKKLEDIKVNIAEIIYMMRKQRKGIVGQGSQLVQIYTLLAKYYYTLKLREVIQEIQRLHLARNVESSLMQIC